MSARRPPCRLYVILAREAPVGVVFRRGPTNHVQIIKWNTADDTFEPGQWFKGRIYELRSDLSPDGKLMVYFALNYSRKRPLKESTWTAVSKPPYLTALCNWFKGDTWFGGGLFETNSELRLNEGSRSGFARKVRKGVLVPNCPLNIDIIDSDTAAYEDLEDARLHRDGWIIRQRLRATLTMLEGQEGKRDIYKKGLIGRLFGSWFGLRTGIDYSKGFTTVQPQVMVREHSGFALQRTITISEYDRTNRYDVMTSDGAIIKTLEGARWADWDHAGRLVFARDGKLFAAAREGRTLLPASEIADFNANEFTPLEAPAWAKTW